MTLDEVRQICKQATWTREISLVELFDELVETAKLNENTFKHSGLEGQATGLIVSTVLRMRRKVKLPIYELGETISESAQTWLKEEESMVEEIAYREGENIILNTSFCQYVFNRQELLAAEMQGELGIVLAHAFTHPSDQNAGRLTMNVYKDAVRKALPE